MLDKSNLRIPVRFRCCTTLDITDRSFTIVTPNRVRNNL